MPFSPHECVLNGLYVGLILPATHRHDGQYRIHYPPDHLSLELFRVVVLREVIFSFLKEVFVMKKILLILCLFCITGCLTTNKETDLVRNLTVTGCPTLIQLTAQDLKELGVDENIVQTWMVNTLSGDIQPCDACEKLIQAAIVLKDKEGIYSDGLAKVIMVMI